MSAALTQQARKHGQVKAGEISNHTAYEHVRLATVSLFKRKLINYLSVDLVRFNFDDSS